MLKNLFKCTPTCGVALDNLKIGIFKRTLLKSFSTILPNSKVYTEK